MPERVNSLDAETRRLLEEVVVAPTVKPALAKAKVSKLYLADRQIEKTKSLSELEELQKYIVALKLAVDTLFSEFPKYKAKAQTLEVPQEIPNEIPTETKILLRSYKPTEADEIEQEIQEYVTLLDSAEVAYKTREQQFAAVSKQHAEIEKANREADAAIKAFDEIKKEQANSQVPEFFTEYLRDAIQLINQFKVDHPEDSAKYADKLDAYVSLYAKYEKEQIEIQIKSTDVTIKGFNANTLDIADTLDDLQEFKPLFESVKKAIAQIQTYNKIVPETVGNFQEKLDAYKIFYKVYAERAIQLSITAADEEAAKIDINEFPNLTSLLSFKPAMKALKNAIDQIEAFNLAYPDEANIYATQLAKYETIYTAYTNRANELELVVLLSSNSVDIPIRKLAGSQHIPGMENVFGFAAMAEPSYLAKLRHRYGKECPIVIEKFIGAIVQINEFREAYSALEDDPLTKLEALNQMIDETYYVPLVEIVTCYHLLPPSEELPSFTAIIPVMQMLPSILPALADLQKTYHSLGKTAEVERVERIDAAMKQLLSKMNAYQTEKEGTSVFKGFEATGEKKTGGANDAGEHGGWLKHTLTGVEGLAKKDPKVAKVIAEKLAGDLICAATLFAAPIDFIQTKPGADETGERTYVFSHKISGFQGDLWQCVYKHAAYSEEEMPASRPRRVGSDKTKQTLLQEYLSHLAEKNPNIKVEFSEIMAASLWTGDFDVHWGNIVVANDENGMPHLHRIDYGGAFKNLHNSHEVHPHSRSRHLPGLGPTNHFREFPRSWRVSMEMVHAIEKLIDINIPKEVENWIAELNRTYDLGPLQKFAKFFGIKEIPDNKAAVLAVLKESLTNAFEKRRESLFNFAREIELSLSVDANNQIIPEKIHAFAAKHPAYTSYCLTNDDFHFRGKGQKKSDFVKKVKPLIIAELRNALDKMAKIAELSSQGAERIAEGSNSEIFRVTHDDKTWAVRKPKTLDNIWYAEANQTAEIFSHSSVFDNPNLVNVHSVINPETNTIDMQVMEFCEGGDLNAKPTALQNFPNIVKQILNGLLGLHTAGYSHNDVKPSNFFVTKEGVIKLGDLGAVLERQALIKRAEGTPEYLPPEFSATTPFVAEKGDVFAFGVTLYNLVFGGDFPKPKTGMNEHGFYFPEIEQLHELDEDTRKALDDLFAQCLEPDPNKRPTLEMLAEHEFLTTQQNLAVEPSAADIQRYVLARAKNSRLMSRAYREERKTALDLVVQTIEREEGFTLNDRQSGKLKDTIENCFIADTAALATETQNIRFYLFNEAKPEEAMAARMHRAYRHKNPLFVCSDNDLISLYNRDDSYDLFCDKILNQVLSPEGQKLRIQQIINRYVEGSILAIANNQETYIHEPYQTQIYDAIFDLMQRHFTPAVEKIQKPIDKQITLALMMYETYFLGLTQLNDFELNNSKLESLNVFLKNILGTENLSLEVISATLKKRKTEPSYLPSEYLQRVIKQIETGKFGKVNSLEEINQTLAAANALNQQLADLFNQVPFDLNMLTEFNRLIDRGAIFTTAYPIYTAVKQEQPIELIKALINVGFDINATPPTEQLRPVVMLEADNKNWDRVVQLILLGANFENLEIFKYAKEEKHDLFKLAADDKVALASKLLDRAFKENNLVYIDVALRYGAKFDLENQNQILFDVVAANGSLDLIRLLVKHGFDLNYTDEAGNGILHIAAQHTHLDLFYQLIQSPLLDIYQKNNAGKNPLQVIAEQGDIPYVKEEISNKILQQVSNIWLRRALANDDDFSVTKVTAEWLSVVNQLCVTMPIDKVALDAKLKEVEVELASDTLAFLVYDIEKSQTDRNMQLLQNFSQLDFAGFDSILTATKQFINQFNAEEYLGSAAKNISLFDAFMQTFPTLTDELGLPVTANRNQVLIDAVGEFMVQNQNNKTYPFLLLIQAANIIYLINEITTNQKRFTEQALVQKTHEEMIETLSTYLTTGSDNYAENSLNIAFRSLIGFIKQANFILNKSLVEPLQETFYQLNVITQELIAEEPAAPRIIQTVNDEMHYRNLLLGLNNANHFEHIETSILNRIEDKAKNLIIARLRELQQTLAENRVAALTLADSTQLPFANFIVGNDKTLASSLYLQKHLSKMTRAELDILLKQRADLIREMMALIQDNAKEKVIIVKNTGERSTNSFKQLFMTDLDLGLDLGEEIAKLFSLTKPINIFNDLQQELATINKLRQLSAQDIIEQVLNDIKTELRDINKIHVLRKSESPVADPIYALPLTERMNILSNFAEDIDKLKQQIERLTESTLPQVQANMTFYQNIFKAVEPDLKAMEEQLQRLEANLALLQTFRKEGIAELQAYEKLITEYTQRRDVLKTTISAYREQFNNAKKTFENDVIWRFDSKVKDLQGEENYLKAYLDELQRKVVDDTATLSDFYEILNHKVKFPIFQNYPGLQQQFNGIYRQFIDRDAAALTKMSRELYLQFKREDLLAARTDPAKYKESSFFKLSKFFNQLSHYVTRNILSYNDINLRTLAIKQWVDTAMAALRNYNDFNVASAINAALNGSALFRLKATFSSCDAETLKNLAELRRLSSEKDSYKNSREALKTSKGFFLPYAGVLTTDMTFNKDGNPWIEDIALNETENTQAIQKAKTLEMYTSAAYATGMLFDLTQELLSQAPEISTFNSVLYSKQKDAVVDDNFDEEVFNLSLLREPRGEETPVSTLLTTGERATLLNIERAIPDQPDVKTTRQLLNERCAARATVYFANGGQAELETTLAESLKETAAEAAKKASKIKLQHRKLLALYSTWKNNIEPNSADADFKKLESMNKALEHYFEILSIEAELDNPALSSQRAEELSLILNDINSALESYKDTLPNIYSSLMQRVFQTKEKLLSFKPLTSAENIAKLEELKSLIDAPLLSPVSDTAQTLKVYTKNLAERMKNVQKIIDAKTFSANYFGFNTLTDEQKILLNGKLVTNLNSSMKSLAELESKLNAEETLSCELLSKLHLQIPDNIIRDSITDPAALAERIISKRVELKIQCDSKLAEIETAKAQLATAKATINEKFQWVHEQHTSNKQLKVVEQFVLTTQMDLKGTRSDDIASLRQDLVNHKKRLEQIELWLLSLPKKADEVSEDFKNQYAKNASRIATLIKSLEILQKTLKEQIQQINQTIAKNPPIPTQPDVAAASWKKPPATTTPDVLVTHSNKPLSIQAHQSVPQPTVSPTVSTAAPVNVPSAKTRTATTFSNPQFTAAPVPKPIETPKYSLISNKGKGGTIGSWKTDSENIITINLLPKYKDTKATIEAALRDTMALSKIAEYEVEHPDKKVRDKTCIWLMSLGKKPFIQDAKGTWVEFNPSAGQRKEIEEKKEKLAEQTATLAPQSSAPQLRRN